MKISDMPIIDPLSKLIADNILLGKTSVTISKDKCKGEWFQPFREIKKVIFNKPATIIIWSDNSKTVVKCEEGVAFDKEKGFLLCWLKGIKGSKTLQKELSKWVKEDE